jgi:hypothetical protein
MPLSRHRHLILLHNRPLSSSDFEAVLTPRARITMMSTFTHLTSPRRTHTTSKPRYIKHRNDSRGSWVGTNRHSWKQRLVKKISFAMRIQPQKEKPRCQGIFAHCRIELSRSIALLGAATHKKEERRLRRFHKKLGGALKKIRLGKQLSLSKRSAHIPLPITWLFCKLYHITADENRSRLRQNRLLKRTKSVGKGKVRESFYFLMAKGPSPQAQSHRHASKCTFRRGRSNMARGSENSGLHKKRLTSRPEEMSNLEDLEGCLEVW